MVLRCPLPLLGFRIQDFHFLWLLIPKYSPIRKEWLCRILQPPAKGGVWALPLSLTATHGISSISFPPGTKMFQFPGFPLFGKPNSPLKRGLPHSETAGSPDTRLLPDEYRRQLRPSSALTTKSSTVCFKRKTGCLRLLPMFSSLFKEQTVDRGRFELPAFAMQKRRSTHWANGPDYQSKRIKEQKYFYSPALLPSCSNKKSSFRSQFSKCPKICL
jgi:hypothetical protein